MNESDLEELIAGGESQTLEFYAGTIRPSVILRCACAFANGKGGRILFGINDRGATVGCKHDFSKVVCSLMNQANYMKTLNPAVTYEVNEQFDKDRTIVCLTIGRSVGVCTYEGNDYYRVGTSVEHGETAKAYNAVQNSGVYNFRIDKDAAKVSSFDATLEALNPFKKWVEHNKGWETIQSLPSGRREKQIQRLIHLCGMNYFDANDIDASFEANEGPGPVDLKVSRGNDKTVIEVKLSSNDNYKKGYEIQIEDYAIAENTKNRVYVYIMDEKHPIRDKTISELYEQRKANGENPPYLLVIDALPRVSPSKKSSIHERYSLTDSQSSQLVLQ